MKIVGTLFLLLITASSAIASIALTQSSELQIPDTVDTESELILTDIDHDSYLDLLINSPTMIGWYSILEGALISSIHKQQDGSHNREYVMGYFDSDNEPDYVETVIGNSELPKNLLAIYYLSSNSFIQTDTISLAHFDQSDSFMVITPSVEDRNQDGMDELYTGCYYFSGWCDMFICLHTDPVIFRFSYQIGDETVGNESAPPMSYYSFDHEACDEPVRFLWGNKRDYGHFHGRGTWDYQPLEFLTMVGADLIARTMIESKTLCLGWNWPSPWDQQVSQVSLVSHHFFDPEAGFLTPHFLARIELSAQAWTYWDDKRCNVLEEVILNLDLTTSDSLTINWQASPPEWATSDIIFADTSSPGQIFLSDESRLYQVRAVTLEKLDSSNVLDLTGHMIGYRPLAENQDPTLLIIDEHRLKFFSFDIVTDIDDRPDQLPTDFLLSQNYPNPFNPSTEIAFMLAEGSDVRLTVFNSLGQVVIVLVDEYLRKGVHQVGWDGTDISGNPVASGLYFYRIQAGDKTATKKMVLLK